MLDHIVIELLCISGIVVSQRVLKPAVVILKTVFDVNVMFAAIAAIFLAVIDQSNSCTLLGRLGLIAVVSYDSVLYRVTVMTVKFTR